MSLMSSTDATFLWETEALRDTTRRRPPPVPTSGFSPPAEPAAITSHDRDWVTLRQAYAATGIPVETLRKWARRGSVPSRLDESVKGTRRMIRLADVMARARELGREVEPVPGAAPPDADPVPSSPDPASAAPPTTVDLGDTVGDDDPAPPVTVTLDEAEPSVDTMIVPIAAWDKMLMQLGNLHEAGQQLAEARERAAKAETENRFLRERLADMRAAQTPESASRSASPAAAAAPTDAKSVTPREEEEEDASVSPRAASPPSRPGLIRSLQSWRIEIRRR